jgi:hypothetical protein
MVIKGVYSDKEVLKNSKYLYNDELSYFSKESSFRLFLYFLDLLLVSYIYLYISAGISGFLNAFCVLDLQPTKTNIKVFQEVSVETFLIIVMIYVVLYYVPQIPSIVPCPHKKHNLFRLKAASIIVTMAIIFGQQRLLNKYQWLIGVDSQTLT